MNSGSPRGLPLFRRVALYCQRLQPALERRQCYRRRSDAKLPRHGSEGCHRWRLPLALERCKTSPSYQRRLVSLAFNVRSRFSDSLAIWWYGWQPVAEKAMSVFLVIAVTASALSAAPQADAGAAETSAADPRPAYDTTTWITSDDWLDHPQYFPGGQVHVRLNVNADGRADGCSIVQTSGSSEFDQLTCRLLMRRGRFHPARDDTGRPVAGSWSWTINWQIPDDDFVETAPAPVDLSTQPVR